MFTSSTVQSMWHSEKYRTQSSLKQTGPVCIDELHRTNHVHFCTDQSMFLWLWRGMVCKKVNRWIISSGAPETALAENTSTVLRKIMISCLLSSYYVARMTPLSSMKLATLETVLYCTVRCTYVQTRLI